MRVAIRVDSSILIGAGHVMRCLVVGKALRSAGWDVLFICRELVGNIIYKLTEDGFQVVRLALPEKDIIDNSNLYASWLAVSMERDIDEVSDVICGFRPDCIIVDHYGLDIQWEKKIRKLCSFVMVIDDLANRQHDCDVLLDQNYFAETSPARYESIVPKRCCLLLGPQYALLGPAYELLRRMLPQRTGEIRRILIYFGNSDLGNKTLFTLHALDVPDLSFLAIDVVIGTGSSHIEKIKDFISERSNFTLYTDVTSLAALMIRADLMIGAGGTTTWERLCLCLPAIVVTLAKNQEKFTKILAKKGLQFSIDSCHDTWTERCRTKVRGLIAQPDLVKTAINKMCIVDGYGVKRLTYLLNGNNIEKIVIRRACPLDIGTMYFWVNDRAVREKSFNTEYISIENHVHWFMEKINSEYCLILIGEDEHGLPLGQVRFDYDSVSQETFVDISVDPCFRGKNIAKKMLFLAIEKFQQMDRLGNKLLAEIKIDNIASQKLFLSLGFRQIQSRRKGSNTFEYGMVL